MNTPDLEALAARVEPAQADDILTSPMLRHGVPLFIRSIGAEEIVTAIERRMYALEAPQQHIAVHWSLLREARDEIEALRAERQEAFDAGFKAAGGTIVGLERVPNPHAKRSASS